MIKFFRKIRQRLLTKHRFSQYLIYAVGEIILVVIGILIALQINNLNEERKAMTRSKDYLTEISKDLVADTIMFNRGIRQISDQMKVEEWALQRMDYSPNQVDSLWMAFGGFYYDYSINDRTFQKIQNAGDSKLTGFESISDRINNYYLFLKDYMDRSTAWDKREVTERQAYMQDFEEKLEISPHRMDILSLGQLEKEFEMKQDSLKHTQLMIEFANSTRVRNHFKNNYTRHLRVRKVFEETKQAAVILFNEINQTLNAHGG